MGLVILCFDARAIALGKVSVALADVNVSLGSTARDASLLLVIVRS